MEIVQGDKVAGFVGDACGTVFATPYLAVGYAHDGKIIGGAVFNGYTGRNVDLSIAHGALSWPPAFVRFFGEYIWDTLKVERVTMIVRPEHEILCSRMGARREGVLRRWYHDGDAIICGLLKEDWKLGR